MVKLIKIKLSVILFFMLITTTFYSCSRYFSNNRNLIQTNINMFVDSNVYLSKDTVSIGDTVLVNIVFYNSSDSICYLYEDANVFIERKPSENIFAQNFVYLSDSCSISKRKIPLQPMEKVKKSYQLIIEPPIFYKGTRNNGNIVLTYLAHHSRNLIDRIEVPINIVVE